MGRNKVMIGAGCVFVAVGVWICAYPTLIVFGAFVMIVGLAGIYFGLGPQKRLFVFKWKKKSPPKKK